MLYLRHNNRFFRCPQRYGLKGQENARSISLPLAIPFLNLRPYDLVGQHSFSPFCSAIFKGHQHDLGAQETSAHKEPRSLLPSNGELYQSEPTEAETYQIDANQR